MASHLRLLSCVFSLLAVQQLPGVAGVTFSLDPVETKTNDQATCGVLHCWEEVKHGSASIISISSLTVYKQEAGRRVTLTTVSQQNPVDNGTFDNIEVDGLWTPEKAEAKLSLVQKNDCTQVQYTCQVRVADEQGKERSRAAVVGGEDVTLTASEMSEDTPLPSNKRSLTGKVSSPQDNTDDKITAMLMALEKVQKTSSNMMETFVKEMKFVKEEIKSVKEEVKSVKEEVNSTTKALGKDIQLVKLAVHNVGWIVIQHRSKGDVDFSRDWASYREGFGNPEGDFWLGNEKVRALTSVPGVRYELRITLQYKGKFYYAHYDRFFLHTQYEAYKIHVGKYSGTAGDSLNNDRHFSTYNRDMDTGNRNCARSGGGGWWFTNCGYANLNGKWREVAGPYWHSLTVWEPVTFSEMKIRKLVV